MTEEEMDKIRIPDGWSALLVAPSGEFMMIFPTHDEDDVVEENEVLIAGLGFAMRHDIEKGSTKVYDFAVEAFNKVKEENSESQHGLS